MPRRWPQSLDFTENPAEVTCLRCKEKLAAAVEEKLRATVEDKSMELPA